MLPDFERADRIGEFWGNPKTRTFAELLIDCEEDRTLRVVLVGMLREVAQPSRALVATGRSLPSAAGGMLFDPSQGPSNAEGDNQIPQPDERSEVDQS
jgi:hypothetical protein